MRSFACLILGLLSVSCLSANGIRQKFSPWPERSNLALGRTVEFLTAPNYESAIDSNITKFLTNGRPAQGNGKIWRHKGVVAWKEVDPIVFVIDLGERRNIQSVALHIAAGADGVYWPTRMLILVDDEAGVFHPVGDVMMLSESPPAAGYAKWWAMADHLSVRGRKVAFAISAPGAGKAFFVDEVEILEGDKTMILESPSGLGFTDLLNDLQMIWIADPMGSQVRTRMRQDLREACDVLEQAQIDLTEKNRLREKGVIFTDRLVASSISLDVDPEIQLETGKTILPLNEFHRDIMAFYGEILATTGMPALTLTVESPYAQVPYVTPLPDFPPVPANVTMMRGEVRPVVVRLFNASGEACTTTLTIEDLPEQLAPVEVHAVEWTDTERNQPIASALRTLASAEGSYTVTIPAGTARQVWLSFKPGTDIPAGIYNGRIIAVSNGLTAQLPLAIRIWDLDFPEEPALHVGGWDFTDDASKIHYFYTTPDNRNALIKLLRAYGIDTPWAYPETLKYGSYDANGYQTEMPDWTLFDQWVECWQGAHRFAVYLYLQTTINGHAPETPVGMRAVKEWFQSIASHVRELGLKPEQIMVHTQDEPSNAEGMANAAAWGRAIAAAESGIVTWTDPLYGYDNKDFPDSGLSDAYDVLCVNRMLVSWYGNRHLAPFLRARENGKRLEVYNCDGPANELDPYSYYRLQAWFAFQIGAEASNFWSFSDTSGISDWEAYTPRTRQSFTPLFLDQQSATPAKPMEAIREGIQDFQYLVELRELAKQLRTASYSKEADEAEALLSNSVSQVLDAQNALQYRWNVEKDRTVADQMRIRIGDFLEKYQALFNGE